MVRAFEPPVYCYHEIVHNRLVVDRFREQGVVFVDDVDEVPAGAPLMLSAHGSAPEVVDAARADGRFVVNAVCPLVTKVHHEAKVRARKGFTVLYVGHAGHDEAVGTLAVAPDAIRLVEHDDDLDRRARRPSPTRRRSRCSRRRRCRMHDWEGIVDRARDASSRSCGPRPATTSASRPPTARPRCTAIAARGRRGRRDRQRQLVEHARARQGGRGGRVPDRVARRRPRRARRSTRARRRDGRRRHRGRERARRARGSGDRARSRRPTASSRCTSPTRTSTSRRRASCAS